MAKQIETLTVIGTITQSGNAIVTVTAKGMSNSPKAISVAVLEGDTDSDVALKCRQTLALDEDVQTFFLVGGTTDEVALTARQEASNDSTMNIAIDNDTCLGLTEVVSSGHTQAGSLTIKNGYASIDIYKSWVTMRGSEMSVDAGDDSVMAILLEAGSRYVDKQTGRKFYTSDADEIRYYTAEDGYILKIGDFVSVSEVAIDISGTRSYVVIPETAYDLTPYNAPLDYQPYSRIEIVIPLSGYAFPATQKGVRVTGKWGWLPIPTDIEEAVMMIAQSTYANRSGQSSSGRVSITAAGIVIRPEDVPAKAQSIITSYRPRV